MARNPHPYPSAQTSAHSCHGYCLLAHCTVSSISVVTPVVATVILSDSCPSCPSSLITQTLDPPSAVLPPPRHQSATLCGCPSPPEDPQKLAPCPFFIEPLLPIILSLFLHLPYPLQIQSFSVLLSVLPAPQSLRTP